MTAIGYARVSTADRVLDLQVDALRAAMIAMGQLTLSEIAKSGGVGREHLVDLAPLRASRKSEAQVLTPSTR